MNTKSLQIPKDWIKVELSSLGIFYKGASISKGQLSENGHNAVRYGELYSTYDFYIKKIRSFISDEVAKTSTKIQYGDILFAGSGETIDEIGKSAVYLLKEDGYASGDTIILRPKKANSLFLAYFLNVGEVRKKLRELGQGQSIVHIYKSDIEKLRFHLPPLSEQNRIAAVLETWDQAVEKLVKKIEIKKNIKKGLMQRLLFGTLRVKGFNNNWKQVKLGNFFSERNERGVQGLPLLSITSDRGVTYQSESNKKDTSNSDKSKYLRICPGDIGYNTMRMWQGRNALSALEGLISPAYTVLKANKDVDSRFFAYLFKMPRIINYFFQKSQGLVSDTLQCRYKDFAIIRCSIPGYEEQTAIADILVSADKEINILEKKLEKLKDQKRYLLNNLLTGTIRTPELLKELA